MSEQENTEPKCPICGGTGETSYPDVPCELCGGTGIAPAPTEPKGGVQSEPTPTISSGWLTPITKNAPEDVDGKVGTLDEKGDAIHTTSVPQAEIEAKHVGYQIRKAIYQATGLWLTDTEAQAAHVTAQALIAHREAAAEKRGRREELETLYNTSRRRRVPLHD